MAEDKLSTPEQELLKLIEGQKSPAGEASSFGPSKKAVRAGVSFFSLGALRGRFSFFQDGLQKIFSGQINLELRSINKILTIVALATALFAGLDLLRLFMGIDRRVEAAFSKEEQKSNFKFQDTSVLKGLSFYLEKSRKRDIFKLPTKEVEKKDEVKKEAVKEIVVRTKNFKLVGISWSEDPDAMIEDTQIKKTFFVKRGSLINEIEVVGIFRDKVVLRYAEDEVELR